MMHPFSEVVDNCVFSSLNALNEAHQKIVDELQRSGATRLVWGLQTINMQKAILAVGMFSMFEAELQGTFGANERYAFTRAEAILSQKGLTTLKEKFADYRDAINVLKHGRGSSYDTLVAKVAKLPFKIMMPDDAFFNEGDVSEIGTLIEVDNGFVRECATIIREVSKAVA